LGQFKEAMKFLVRALGLNDPKMWDRTLWNLAGSQSASGEVVTERTALYSSAVYNAISLISGTIAALPCHLMQGKMGKKTIVEENPLYRVMHDQWNPYLTAMAGRECLMAHILAWGNGYAEIVRDTLGYVRELWPITPDRVRVFMHGSDLFYEIQVDREKIILPRNRVLHVPGLGYDGFMGYSVVAMARKSFGLTMALETFGSNYFGQGTHPGVIVTHPGKLSAQASSNLQASLATDFGGLGKTHKLLLLEEGLKMEKISIPPDDSQFLESRQFQIPEVARWFNLPPHKLKDLTRSSFSNIEQEQQSFYTDSILPWLVRLEQNYNMQLLDRYDKSLSGYGRLYFKHSVEGLLRGDSASRAALYTAMFNVGSLSPNDIRGYEDKDPIPGGDEYFVPLNMVPLSMVKDEFKKKLQAPAPVPQKGNGKDTSEEEGAEAENEQPA